MTDQLYLAILARCPNIMLAYMCDIIRVDVAIMRQRRNLLHISTVLYARGACIFPTSALMQACRFVPAGYEIHTTSLVCTRGARIPFPGGGRGDHQVGTAALSAALFNYSAARPTSPGTQGTVLLTQFVLSHNQKRIHQTNVRGGTSSIQLISSMCTPILSQNHKK